MLRQFKFASDLILGHDPLQLERSTDFSIFLDKPFWLWNDKEHEKLRACMIAASNTYLSKMTRNTHSLIMSS